MVEPHCVVETGSEEMQADTYQTVSSSILMISNEELERMLAKARAEGRAEGRAEDRREIDALTKIIRWLEKAVQTVVQRMEQGTLTLPKDTPPISDGKSLGKD